MGDFSDLARRAHVKTRLCEGLVTGLAWGAGAATVGVLFAKAFSHTHPALLAPALAALALGALVGALVRLRRVPSAESLAAIADDAAHAGGLYLVSGLPGAGAWPTPTPVAPRVESSVRSRLRAAIPALLILAGALAVPARWFALTAPPAHAPFPDVAAPVRAEIAELRAEETLDEETLEELAEELARIEAAADTSAPADTLDAVDRLAERLNALIDMNADTARRLTADNRTLSTLANAAETADILRQMLAGAPDTSDPTRGTELRRCKGGGGSEGEGEGVGEGEGEGEGGSPGKGGVRRGRGDAPIAWGDPVSENGVTYRDETSPADVRKDDVGKIGESISDEDPAANVPHTPGGATAIGGVSSGASVNRSVSPRHRAAVKRFFSSERTAP